MENLEGFGFGSGGFGFTQSSRTGQGITEIKRVDTASVVVAVDETGDFETIQEAINSLNGEGGYIQVKEGTYTIKETLQVPANITIQGTGRNTKIQASNITTILNLTGNDTTFLNLSFIGELESTGTSITKRTDTGINTNEKERIKISNCFFSDLNYGIYGTAYSFNASLNHFQKCNKGIYIGGICGVISSNIMDYETSGENGITSRGFTYVSITGNSGFMDSGFIGDSGDYKNTITGNNFSEDGSIEIKGDNNIFVANISDTITDTGTGSIIEHNQ